MDRGKERGRIINTCTSTSHVSHVAFIAGGESEDESEDKSESESANKSKDESESESVNKNKDKNEDKNKRCSS